MESKAEISPATLLLEFQNRAGSSPWGLPYHAYFEGKAGPGQRKQHLAISFAVHGNEWGTLAGALRLLDALASGALSSAGPVSLLIGNPEAVQKDCRFIEEDLNRVFTFDQPAASLERRRAEELRPLLDEVDFLLDFHQTQTPTEHAFWTFPWNEEYAHWARVIGAAPVGLTRAPGGAFAPGRRCMDEYIRERGKIGITAELGTRGHDDKQATVAFESAKRLLQAYDKVCLQQSALSELAESCEAIQWYETVEVVQTVDESSRLRPGLGCWTAVDEGEILSAEGAPKIVASTKGRVLFPKYVAQGETPPPEIMRLAAPIDDPSTRYR